jgi:hypothetical protein
MASSSLIVILNSLRLERFADPVAGAVAAAPAPNARAAIRSASAET